MNTFFPIFLILCLGTISAFGLHRRHFPFWVVSLGGGLVGAILWNVGVLLLFALTAPSELGGGGILWEVELKIFLTALAPACLVALLLWLKTDHGHPPVGDEA